MVTRTGSAIVFDWDGTLIDSAPLTSAIWREQLDRYGAHVTNADVEALFGMGWPQAYRWLAERHELPPQEMVAADLRRGRNSQRHRLALFTDTVECLAELRCHGVSLGLATNSDAKRLQADLDAMGLPFDWFGAVACPDARLRAKPAPDLYLDVADQLECVPARSIAIEDTGIGARAAADAGYRVLHLVRGRPDTGPLPSKYPTISGLRARDILARLDQTRLRLQNGGMS
ncbi:HAD family phosphatase [Nonomuraea sp. NPDC049625]|uniref:HAD family hydrolase n=1 Tax=Nonomuraea sp. NPDC049625 TaxID=3155775 RepID=UPI0034283D1C